MVARWPVAATEPDVLAVIAVGGMLGAAARFKLAEALPTKPGHFPWATFWTNLSGSFLLGFLLIVLLERFPPTRYVRPFLATGILGAFTTMSTYTVETALLMKDDHAATAVAVRRRQHRRRCLPRLRGHRRPAPSHRRSRAPQR